MIIRRDQQRNKTIDFSEVLLVEKATGIEKLHQIVPLSDKTKPYQYSDLTESELINVTINLGSEF